MNTAQSLTAETGSVKEAAAAFKAAMTPPAPRDELGRYAQQDVPETVEEPEQQEPEQQEAEQEAVPEADEADDTQPEYDPPVSWSDEDKAAWSAIPVEAQAVIARRESERDQYLNQRTMELANERKKVEGLSAVQQEAAQARQQYAAALDELLTAQSPQPPSINLINPQSPEYNPDEYNLQRAYYEQALMAQQQIAAQRDYLRAQEQQDAQRKHAEWQQQESSKLVTLIPDFADPSKGPRLAQELTEYATRNGYPAEALADASATDLHMAWKAMMYDRGQTAKAAAKPATQAAPPSARPGVQVSRHAISEKNRQSALDRLNKSGSIEDAAYFFKQAMRK